MFPSIHVRNTIEHLIESGIIEGELADTWKERMAKKREEEAEVKGWKEAAEKGDTDAMYELGLCYVHGKKVSRQIWKRPTNGLKRDMTLVTCIA